MKVFNGVVIVTFEDEESAKKFLAVEDLQISDRKIKKFSLVESNERREKYLEEKEASKKKKVEQAKIKKKEEAEKKKKVEEKPKNDKSTSPIDCIVVCRGFQAKAINLQEVMKYFYDNHEKVIDVNMEAHEDKAFITFMNKGAADRFKDLAYVRFKGKPITRSSVQEFKEGKKGKKGATDDDKAGVKRKIAEEEKKPVELEDGAAIKITGIKNKNTKALDLKDKLKNLEVKWEDVVYVRHQKGEEEAQVKLTGKAKEELDEKAKEHLATFTPKKKKNRNKQ